MCSKPALSQQVLTTYHTTFCEMPFPPYLSRPGDGSKDPSLLDPGCHRPLIERGFDPFWNGNGADVSALANQVHHHPVRWRI